MSATPGDFPIGFPGVSWREDPPPHFQPRGFIRSPDSCKVWKPTVEPVSTQRGGTFWTLHAQQVQGRKKWMMRVNDNTACGGSDTTGYLLWINKGTTFHLKRTF
ncbi:Hypothetical predicted protein [Scomber scombrus]|uniref:Uncharacterized protein n=1 Tax=Scomber scombrus TaxID=13677 RepID=A0AAV1NSW9_SCOSC